MNLSKLKQELLSQVNEDSQVEREKVERYVSLTETYKKLQKEAIKNPVITVENGSQRFIKTNPAINDMNRINSSLIALGKDMGLATPPTEGKNEGHYSASDLT